MIAAALPNLQVSGVAAEGVVRGLARAAHLLSQREEGRDLSKCSVTVAAKMCATCGGR